MHGIDYLPLMTQIPDSTSKRLEILNTFRQFWYPDQPPADVLPVSISVTETQLEIKLPIALIEWHRQVWPTSMTDVKRGRILPLNELYFTNEMLIVRKQPVFNGIVMANWGIHIDRLNEDDPPVESIIYKRRNRVSENLSTFALYCAAYDTTDKFAGNNAEQLEGSLPEDAIKMDFPDSFGVIETAIYEGRNWIALTSGSSIYLRRRDPATGKQEFLIRK